METKHKCRDFKLTMVQKCVEMVGFTLDLNSLEPKSASFTLATQSIHKSSRTQEMEARVSRDSVLENGGF